MENIFVSDIDGTLTSFGSPVLDEYGIKSLKKASQWGEIILASARPYSGIISMYNPEELEIDYIISLNGGHILYKNKTLFTFPVPSEVVTYFIKNKDRFENLWFYTEFHWYASTMETDVYKKESYAVNSEAILLNKFKSENVLKILAVCESDRDIVVSEIGDKFSGVNVTSSSESYVEIFSSQINKFNAVETIFRDKETQIFAFGDSNNDLEMIKNSFLGCAVNNATPQVKAVADYISSFNFGKGVYDSLEYIQKKYLI
ncbi:HAD-IIB family hydrolase [Apibacter sp. HY039]|uniref:HAD-IIB family hydrolase n=1 Tax=Apibacter sp. HY039 TaxID=2501476 RepID=UPI000FEBC277|nr:HAD-IIB family hydrolase [Apibacter sp. HY039]